MHICIAKYVLKCSCKETIIAKYNKKSYRESLPTSFIACFPKQKKSSYDYFSKSVVSQQPYLSFN